MADDDNFAGAILGFLFFVFLVVAVVALAIFLFGSVGAIYGSGISIYNYFKSLFKNVKPEKPVYA